MGPCGPGPYRPGPYGRPWALMCRALLGFMGCTLWAPWALMGRPIMGRALMGVPGRLWAVPLWARLLWASLGPHGLGSYGPGPYGPPWALMARALMGRALLGRDLLCPRALMGQAPTGPLGAYMHVEDGAYILDLFCPPPGYIFSLFCFQNRVNVWLPHIYIHEKKHENTGRRWAAWDDLSRP